MKLRLIETIKNFGKQTLTISTRVLVVDALFNILLGFTIGYLVFG